MGEAPQDAPLAQLTIVSGGQTGVDRAALDFAIAHAIAHEGWCPRDRRAEDGPLAKRYVLKETPSHRYTERTAWNVRDSDATVVFSIAPDLKGGTAYTVQEALAQQKPVLHLARDATPLGATAGGIRESAERLHAFLQTHHVARLNVAGPRATQEPDGASFVWAVLSSALASG